MFEKLLGLNNLVAVDIGASSVKIAEVDVGSRGAVLKKFGVFPISHGLVNNGEIVEAGGIGQAIESLVKTAKTKRKMASSTVWGNSVIVKKISMPRMEANLVAEQIRWEAEQYIPFDVNEISLDHHILESRSAGGESMEVLIVAAKQDFLMRIIETMEIGGLKCSLVDVAGFALANCFEANYGVQPDAVALLNIGASFTNFVVVDKGEVVFSRDVPVGGLTYTLEMNKTMGVSFHEAESLKISASLGQEVPAEVNGLIAQTTEQVVDEIKNSFEFYGATSAGAPVSKFYVSGGSIFVPGLVEQISKTMGIPFEAHDPFMKIAYDTKAFTPDYIEQIKSISPVVLGLAMRKLGEK